MTASTKTSGFLGLATAVVVAGFFFVSPIPHTAALRSLLLVALAGLFMAIRPAQGGPSWRHLAGRSEFRLLAALTLYMLMQSLLWAEDRGSSLGSFAAEWCATLLVAWIGYGVARATTLRTEFSFVGGSLPTWAALALAMHAFWMLGYQSFYWVGASRYPFGQVPYGNYSTLSTPVNMAFALLLADIAVRWLVGRKLFPWSERIAWALLAAVTAAVIAVKARNGIVTSCALLVLTAGLGLLRQRSRRAIGITAVAVALGAVLAVGSIGSDGRWGILVESAVVATDTEKHRAWMDDDRHPLPAFDASKERADHSAYMRVAWAKVAMEGIIDHPFGYGYGLGGFGRYVEEKYGRTGFVSSHSGLLDFALANGVPGLLLLLAFAGALARRGLMAWASGNPWGLALLLTLANYLIRIALDGHFGSFRLKMVALLLGILYCHIVTLEKAKEPSQPTG